MHSWTHLLPLSPAVLFTNKHATDSTVLGNKVITRSALSPNALHELTAFISKVLKIAWYLKNHAMAIYKYPDIRYTTQA